MPALPANFMPRLDLQRLVARCNELLHATDNEELIFGLKQMLVGAAYLDGVLSEIPHGSHPVDKILDNPNAWQSRWLDGSFALHTRNGLFRVVYGQQVLETSQKSLVSTGRYRLVFGEGADEERHISGDRQYLRQLINSYLDKFRGVLPESVESACEGFFPDVKERNHAVRVEGATALDVRQPPAHG